MYPPIPPPAHGYPDDDEERPPFVLIEPFAYFADRDNATTAACGMSGFEGEFKVTFCTTRPPLVSYMCFEATAYDHTSFAVAPRIITTETDGSRVLLSVVFGNNPSAIVYSRDRQYLLYDASGPSLEHLPHPGQLRVCDDTLAFVRKCTHGDGASNDCSNSCGYVLAAHTGVFGDARPYNLYLYHSDTKTWQQREMVLKPSPYPVPSHCTSKAISIGGDQGTVAWVDLWHNIILCDVLANRPELRSLELPQGGVQPGNPRSVRDIALLDGLFKYVQIQPGSRVSGHWEWEVTVWSAKPSSSLPEDWITEYNIKSREIPEPMLQVSPGEAQPTLASLYIGLPNPSLQDAGIVYLLSKVHFCNSDCPAWVLAVDMRSKTIQKVAEFSAARTLGLAKGYDASGFSKFLKRKMMQKEQRDGAVAAQVAEKPAEGELHRYSVTVKTESGEKLELQLGPGDSVIDLKQFLLDAHDTCFYTCYDLIFHSKDGSGHQLEDYNEISDIVDITTGRCLLEMVAATYDDRSIKVHLCRVRELLSRSSLHRSPSTSLALQQESAHARNAGKTAGQELDGLNFTENNTSAFTSLLASAPAEINCVHSIVFSPFNPPLNYWRIRGHLIYIDVVTLEKNKFCITGCSTSFYVNASNGHTLNPRPAKNSYEASTLVGLLQSISAKFKEGFREILEKAPALPFQSIQPLLPVTSWLGAYPVHARVEDSVLPTTITTEWIDIRRDWNKEMQSCREFPHGNLQERILRGRALYKVTCDFVVAAVKGAIGVIHRSIPPLKQNGECNSLYLYNDILFSTSAVDFDYEHILMVRKSDCQNVPGRSTPVPSLDLGANADRDHADSTVALNSNTEEPNSVLEASAEAQLADSEQQTYACANNVLNGIKSYQEADIPGLYNVAMAIIDYRGHRVVAQSVPPGLFKGDKPVYGSDDNGKNIHWNEAFHAKVVEAAKRFHVKEHFVLDGSGNPVKLAASVECLGILGSDDRHYICEPMGVTPRDSNYIGLQHRFCVLRPELIASFVKAESTKKSPVQKVSDVPAEMNGPEFKDQQGSASDATAASVGRDDNSDEGPASTGEILFNPNVFTGYKLAGSPEEIAADEALVKKVGSYLLDTVIPKFVQDLCSLDVSPMDGQTLTDVLHSNGINVRYLGKVAGMIKHLPHLQDLFSAEIIVRSAKHVVKEILRQSPLADISGAVAHFLNCFAGKVLAVSTKGSAGSTQSKTQKAQKSSQSSPSASSRKGQSVYFHLTSDGVWSDIKEFAIHKYQFEVLDDARFQAKKVAVLRNLCQKVGVTIAARKYELDSAAPFQDSDILNLQPIVKHSVPTCTDARKLMEAGKIRMTKGKLNEACTKFSEAFSLVQQINGPMQKDAANCCRYLAMVLYRGGDKARAILLQHQELIINERCLGLDHPNTARSYNDIALFYYGHKQTELALQHMSHILLLLSLASGPDHPDVAQTLINVAMMYQNASNMSAALRYLQAALEKIKRTLGPDHIQTSLCYHHLAVAFSSMGVHKLSVREETKTHGILVKQFGSDDSRTRDSKNWLKMFKEKEQQVNAQKQKDHIVKGP